MKRLTITAVKRRNKEKRTELLNDICAIFILIFAFAFMFLTII